MGLIALFPYRRVKNRDLDPIDHLGKGIFIQESLSIFFLERVFFQLEIRF